VAVVVWGTMRVAADVPAAGGGAVDPSVAGGSAAGLRAALALGRGDPAGQAAADANGVDAMAARLLHGLDRLR
jgi:hypothetical protein